MTENKGFVMEWPGGRRAEIVGHGNGAVLVKLPQVVVVVTDPLRLEREYIAQVNIGGGKPDVVWKPLPHTVG